MLLRAGWSGAHERVLGVEILCVVVFHVFQSVLAEHGGGWGARVGAFEVGAPSVAAGLLLGCELVVSCRVVEGTGQCKDVVGLGGGLPLRK